MTTYVYETVPKTPDNAPRYLEIKQSMKDEPLTHDPATGEPIRRVVLGGFGLLSSRPADAPPSSSSHSCCRRSGCCA